MIFILILGAIVIISIFALLAFIIIKVGFKFIDSMEKSDNKAIRSTKKDGYRFLYSMLKKDYDTDRHDLLARTIVYSIALCLMVLFFWFSVGINYL